jgi:putative transposase
VLAVANSPEFRGLSPKQIVPRLADEGVYLASESTVYRILRDKEQLKNRTPARSPTPRPKPRCTATGPNQLWSWDITYLKSSIRGRFLYLYMVVDVWSRKIVGWAVHRQESANEASRLISKICRESKLDPAGLVLHSDNGGPMRGATMLATLQWLGIVPSFSRPHVKDDNPYSEALFRTVKYRPAYPKRPFNSVEHARAWVTQFVRWYNHEHRHSAIRYVTPAQRHEGLDEAILARRKRVYELAKRRRPVRWTGQTRNCTPVRTVSINPPELDVETGAA